MTSILAGRFNFGFALFSLVILSSVSSDSNGTTTVKDPDLLKDINSTEKFTTDQLNSISTTLQTDNSVDGRDLSVTTNADFATDAKIQIDDLSTANGNYEGSLNATVEPKSITTPSHRYNSVAVSETTVARVEDDQTTTTNSDEDAFWTAKVNNSAEQVQNNNSISHQENISLLFVGNSLGDVINSSNAKPTKETIMGVGIKATVSVSLRVEDANITRMNLIDAEKIPRNSSCQSFNGNNETTNLTARNSTCYEATENVTDAGNETAQSTEIPQKYSAEDPVPGSISEAEINLNAIAVNETETNSHQPNSTEMYLNTTEAGSIERKLITETNSNATYHHYSTENDLTQLNTTEINVIQNETETTVEELSNSTATTLHGITNTSFSVNNISNETYTDSSTLPFTSILNNKTFEPMTTGVMTQPSTINTSWPTTETETENATATDLITTTPEPLIRFAGVIKVVGGLNWTSELLNRQSFEYKRVANVIKSLLKEAFNSSAVVGILRDVEIDGFSEGSVLVDYILIVVKSDVLDLGYLVHAFNMYFKSNSNYSHLIIDPKATYFEAIPETVIKPTSEPRVEPPVPQWVVAVVVIAAASLVFIILFAAVTIYGRHYGRRSYNKKLQGNEIIFDKPDYQSGPRLSDSAYENLAADAVYDVESSPEKIDGMLNSADNQFDSWRTNRLTRMSSTKRFSFNSS